MDRHSDYGEKRFRLARAYVPLQPYCRQFPLDIALMKGTIFTCLYFPLRDKRKDY